MIKAHYNSSLTKWGKSTETESLNKTEISIDLFFLKMSFVIFRGSIPLQLYRKLRAPYRLKRNLQLKQCCAKQRH
jgi:hypothetical protein